MSPFEYNVIAILAAVCSVIIGVSKGWHKGSVPELFAFLIMYGISFLAILFVFWVAKIILG